VIWHSGGIKSLGRQGCDRSKHAESVVRLWAFGNVGLCQRTQKRYSKCYFASCSECWFARQVGDIIYLHRYPESENLVVRKT